MRAIVQRVQWAEVEADGEIVGRIEAGLLVYIGVGLADTSEYAAELARKVAHLRIFPDKQDKMNLDVEEIGGEILVVPNFTLMADARKGRRPAFNQAAPAAQALPLQEFFIRSLIDQGCRVATGSFGADMTVRSAGRGPVNIILDVPPAAVK